MSIFKTILSPFIEFNEPAETTAPKATNATVPEKVTNQEPVVNTTNNAAVNAGSSNNFTNHFNQLIEEANKKNPLFEGADLKEYMDTIVELDTIADEEARIKTAFNILKKSGLTKERLLSTGQEYVKLIEHDLAGIEGAFAQQYKNEVELKEQQIQAKAQEIKELNDKIAAINQEISDLSNGIAQSKAQLTSNKDQFIIAGRSKKAELETELEKIKQYI